MLLLNVIPEDKITLDFLEFLQIFKRFSGETMLELVFCGKNARLSREKCRKNARNFIFWCKFSVIYDKKSAAAAKKSLANYKKDGIIPDGKAQLLNRYKKGPDRSRVQASFASVILS